MKIYNLTYFLREGIHSVFSHRLMSFAAMSVIMACLLLMGSFSLVAANIEEILEDVENKNEIVAYVDETLPDNEARAIESSILDIQGVKSVIYTGKDEALEAFKEDFGDESELLEGLDERNPLRNRYTVTMDSIDESKNVASRLALVPGIAKVSARSDISDKIIKIRDVTTVICMVLIIILILVSVFIISNTVNLTIFNRREEIAIMKMIGATNGFVRVPFIVEGLLIGIVGAAVALGIQWGVYEYVVSKIFTSYSFFPAVPFKEMISYLCAMFFGTGVLVGGLGSAITLGKFLKV